MAIFNVKNRGASWVTYKIPEDGIRRSFAPGEVKRVSDTELEKLTYQPGGMVILSQFLQIQDEVALKNLNIHTEPEYYMSEADVAALIKTGSLDAFLDALDFAPVGVVDLIKKLSLDIPLMDLSKRKALKDKTGLDVDAALKNREAEKEDENAGNTILKQTERRVKTEDVAPGRRTTVPKYNIIKTDPEPEANKATE